MARKKTHEEFVAEVRALVGDEYTVIGTYTGAKNPVDILHKRCGTVYSPRPTIFLSGGRCFNCYGNKKKTTEEFKQEVFKLVGTEYEILGEYKTSHTKIRILHKTCGEIYTAVPASFLNGNRCAKCSNKKKKTTEEFKQEVFKLVGTEYEILGEYKNNNTKIQIQHKTCGEIYEASPNNFKKGRRCPKCAESRGEKAIKEWLLNKNIKFVAQKPIKYSRTRKALLLDILAQGVAIEYDGEFHYKPIRHAGGEEGLRYRQHLDAIKDKYCADNGIPLIRIPYWDFDNIDAILTEKLLPLLNEQKAS